MNKETSTRYNSSMEAHSPKSLLTRREILEVGAVGIASFFLGCEFLRKRESKKERADEGLSADDIRNHLQEYYIRIQQDGDPHGYFKLLRLNDKECIVPDDILLAYATVLHRGESRAYAPYGTYIQYNYLQDQNLLNDFRKQLIQLEEIGLFGPPMPLSFLDKQFYEQLFSTTGTIILRESLLQDRRFEVSLSHERVHEILNHLPQKQYIKMGLVANKVVAKINSEWPDTKNRKCVDEAVRAWEEFYAYLATGEFEDSVEEELKKYRDAYKIFLIIKKQSQLDKHNTPVK